MGNCGRRAGNTEVAVVGQEVSVEVSSVNISRAKTMTHYKKEGRRLWDDSNFRDLAVVLALAACSDYHADNFTRLRM